MVIGGHVTSGKITRNAQVRVVRDGIIVADDKVEMCIRDRLRTEETGELEVQLDEETSVTVEKKECSSILGLEDWEE